VFKFYNNNNNNMSSFLKVPNTVSRRHSTPDEVTTGLATIVEVKL
jgi:hypothetical protein